MIKGADKGFTVELKIDYVDDPEGDKELAQGKNSAGSFWMAHVSDIKDSQNRVLNQQSCWQIESLVKSGGLKSLLKEMQNAIPRLLDENGLINK